MNVEYKVVPEGTGAMLDALENKLADVATTVTDVRLVSMISIYGGYVYIFPICQGLIAGIAKKRKVEMIGTFVESPLIW